MNTPIMHIPVPDPLDRRVKEVAEEERFSDPNDYVRELIREDLKRREEKRLEKMLLEGLESGSSVFGPDEWKNFKAEVLASAGKQSPAL